MYDYKPDPLIQAFDKAANEPIQELAAKYLQGDEKAGMTIEWRLRHWLTPTDQQFIRDFVKQHESKESDSGGTNCLLGMICHHSQTGVPAANLAKAKDYYKKAMVHNSALGFAQYGWIVHSEKNLDNAIGYYNQALVQSPHHALALLHLGYCSINKGNSATGEENLQRAAEQFPLYASNLASHRFNPVTVIKALPLHQTAALQGYSGSLINIATTYSQGALSGSEGAKDNNKTLAAYYYRVAGAPSCVYKDHKQSCKTHLSTLQSQNPQNTVIAYHNIIFLQDTAQLKTLFKKETEKFVEYVTTYDLHRLQYEPWLKEQLTTLLKEPTDDYFQDLVRHCLRALVILATLEDAPAEKAASLDEAAKALSKINAIEDINSPYAVMVVQTCLRVNAELAKLSGTEEKSTPAPVDLHSKLALFVKIKPSFLWDEVQGLPTLLKSTLAMDDSSRAILESYAPHTRHKQKTPDKDKAKEQKADLFDLQHYIELDDKKFLRKEERKQLRKATYGLMLTTLAGVKTTAEEVKDDAVTPKKPDVKQALNRILTNALAQEIASGEGEFADILRGLQNHLDHVIVEYQCFSQLFKKDLDALPQQEKNSTYIKIIASLNQQPAATQAAADPANTDASPQRIGRGSSYLEAPNDDYAGAVVRQSNQQQSARQAPEVGNKSKIPDCRIH